MTFARITVITLACLTATVACDKDSSKNKSAPAAALTLEQVILGYWQQTDPAPTPKVKTDMPHRLGFTTRNVEGVIWNSVEYCGIYGTHGGRAYGLAGNMLEISILTGVGPKGIEEKPFSATIKMLDRNTMVLNGTHTYTRAIPKKELLSLQLCEESALQ